MRSNNSRKIVKLGTYELCLCYTTVACVFVSVDVVDLHIPGNADKDLQPPLEMDGPASKARAPETQQNPCASATLLNIPFLK